MSINEKVPSLPTTPTLSKNLRCSDSPKITKLTAATMGSPKVRHHAVGFIEAKLVMPGDFVYLNDKLCKVISKSNNHITALDKTNNTINYSIKHENDELRFDMLHPSTYERKVKVCE
jgi:hypothetical protein